MIERVRREDRDAQLRHLRSRVESVRGRRLDLPVLPVTAALADLLPPGGLRAGSVYSISSSSALLSALLLEPSRSGAWCAVIGVPNWGVEFAEHLGVNLSRVVLIPEPGSRWSAVMATVADALPVVVVRPRERVTDAYAARLSARLRERGTTLIVQGHWPNVEAVIDVADPHWSGLGSGHGYLSDRRVAVRVTSRRWMHPRRGQVLLPAADGTARSASVRPAERTGVLEAVG